MRWTSAVHFWKLVSVYVCGWVYEGDLLGGKGPPACWAGVTTAHLSVWGATRRPSAPAGRPLPQGNLSTAVSTRKSMAPLCPVMPMRQEAQCPLQALCDFSKCSNRKRRIRLSLQECSRVKLSVCNQSGTTKDSNLDMVICYLKTRSDLWWWFKAVHCCWIRSSNWSVGVGSFIQRHCFYSNSSFNKEIINK